MKAFLINIYSLIIVIILQYSISWNVSMITLPLTRESGYYFVNVSVGTPQQNIVLMLDILSNSTWVAGSKCSWFYGYVAENMSMFTESKSSSLAVSNVSISSRKELSRIKAEGFASSDYFTVANSSVGLFNFVLADYYLSDIPANGLFGFDKGDTTHYNSSKIKMMNANSFMMLDSLYENRVISIRVFYINNSKSSLTLNIGDYPIINTNYSTCTNQNLTYENVFKLNENETINSHWMCKLSSIFTGDFLQLNSIMFDKILLFSSTINGMLISSDYQPFFEKNFFYGLKINNCFTKVFGNTNVFACLKSFNISIFPVLNLQIDGWIYSFQPESLFDTTPPKDYYFETSSSPSNVENDDQYTYFKIRFVNKQRFNLNYTIIGIEMFDDIIVFDKEKDEVGFFTSAKIFKQNLVLPTPGMSLVILLVIIIVSFFVFVIIMVIGYVCCIHLNEKNKREYQLDNLSRDIDDNQEIKQI